MSVSVFQFMELQSAKLLEHNRLLSVPDLEGELLTSLLFLEEPAALIKMR